MFSATQHADHIAAGKMDAHATCKAETISFKNLFLSQEQDDEESASLADALIALVAKWPGQTKFKATDVERMVNDHSEFASDDERERCATLREFLFPTLPPNQIVTAKATGKRLKRHIGEPVKAGDTTLILKAEPDTHTNALAYFVEARRDAASR